MKQMIYKGPGVPPGRMVIPVWDPNKLAMVHVPVEWYQQNGNWITNPLPDAGVQTIVNSSRRTARKVVEHTELSGNPKQQKEKRDEILKDSQYYDFYEPPTVVHGSGFTKSIKEKAK